jgi:hypothetical protein
VPWTPLQDPWEGTEPDYLPSDDETPSDCGNRQSSNLSEVTQDCVLKSTKIIDTRLNLSDACLTLEAFQDFVNNNRTASQKQIAELLLKSLTLVVGQIDKFMLVN